ncbi:MAG: hypothetical protein CL460_06530 [Acidimicrobiaceae bacterium]|nr:hypothetical protein [Acidimicrobiaceae bacterium]
MSRKLPKSLSLRWWFEDASTGRIVVAQRPNLLLGICVIGVLASWVWSQSAGVLLLCRISWLTWAADELFRGVNPWRRLLGFLVGLFTILN